MKSYTLRTDTFILNFNLHAKVDITKDSAVALMKECFVTAGERDIYCGDSVEIKIITAAGIETEIFQLKKD